MVATAGVTMPNLTERLRACYTGAVHAVLRTPDVNIDAFQSRLRALGLSVTGVDRVMPSLEDVFLRLTGSHLEE